MLTVFEINSEFSDGTQRFWLVAATTLESARLLVPPSFHTVSATPIGRAPSATDHVIGWAGASITGFGETVA